MISLKKALSRIQHTIDPRKPPFGNHDVILRLPCSLSIHVTALTFIVGVMLKVFFFVGEGGGGEGGVSQAQSTKVIKAKLILQPKLIFSASFCFCFQSVKRS